MMDVIVMPLAFDSMAKRRELFHRLVKEGFHARMHAYEYFIRRRKFVCALVLYPVRNSVTIYRIDWNLKESEEAVKTITKILREMDPKLEIEISKV